MSVGVEALKELSSEQFQQLRARVWSQVTTQIDGIAIGSAVNALQRRGVLEQIAAEPGISVGEIVRRCGCRPGYLHVILKLLAIQGWLVREGSVDDSMRLWLDSCALELPRLAHLYANSRAAMRVMQSLAVGSRSPESPAVWQLCVHRWGSPEVSQLAPRIHSHLDGHLAAGVLAGLARNGNLPDSGAPGRPLAIADLAEEAGIDPEIILHFLRLLGWAHPNERFAWTAEGLVAALMQPQFWYPLTYAETILDMDARLGGSGRRPHRTEAGDEAHLDRRLDIRFSGEVFNRNCRGPLLAMLQPVFAQSPDNHPGYLVDVGCGDGALLAFAWHAAVEQASRAGGQVAHPLIAVGIDVSPVAREAAAARLSAEVIPNLVLPGDVADPAAIRIGLLEHGIRCEDSLFLAKSVIHNRRYRPPVRHAEREATRGDGLVFVTEGGDLLHTEDVEESLVELLSAWRPLLQRHGWMVIEAHTAPAEIGAANLGRSLLTILDATHGFSHQYLLTPQRFRAAAARAGFASSAQAETGEAEVGHTVLTYDHFIPSGIPR